MMLALHQYTERGAGTPVFRMQSPEVLRMEPNFLKADYPLSIV